MKKITIICSILFVSLLISCKKEYTCKCTYVDSSDKTNVNEVSYTLKDKKKNLTERCDSYEVAVNSTTTWDCEIQ